MPDQFSVNRDRMHARERIGVGGVLGEKRKILLGHHPTPFIIPFDKGVRLTEEVPGQKDTWPAGTGDIIRWERDSGGSSIKRKEIVLRFETPVTNLMFFTTGNAWQNDVSGVGGEVTLEFSLILANLNVGVDAIENWSWTTHGFTIGSAFYTGAGFADRWMDGAPGQISINYINFDAQRGGTAAIGTYTIGGDGQPVEEVLSKGPITGVHLYVNETKSSLPVSESYSGSPGDRPGNTDKSFPTWFGVDSRLLPQKPFV